jgi:hypothetical protein
MDEELRMLLSKTINTITDTIDGDMDEYPELAAINEKLCEYYFENLKPL